MGGRAMIVVTVHHVRALCARSQNRTVLVLDATGELKVITPQQAFDGSYNDDRGYRVLCTSTDLEDGGLRVGRDGQLVGPTVKVCTEVAQYLTAELAGAA